MTSPDRNLALRVPSISASNSRSDMLWTGRPRPHADELLSSWLARLAATNGLKLHTFTSQTWPTLSVWNCDIDGFVPHLILDTLSRRTGVPMQDVRELTLGDYAGRVFEKHQARGLTAWILPLGLGGEFPSHLAARSCR